MSDWLALGLLALFGALRMVIVGFSVIDRRAEEDDGLCCVGKDEDCR